MPCIFWNLFTKISIVNILVPKVLLIMISIDRSRDLVLGRSRGHFLALAILILNFGIDFNLAVDIPWEGVTIRLQPELNRVTGLGVCKDVFVAKHFLRVFIEFFNLNISEPTINMLITNLNTGLMNVGEVVHLDRATEIVILNSKSFNSNDIIR